MLKDAMTEHLTGCGGADLPNLLTSASSALSELFFFRIKQKNCATLTTKQLPYNFTSKHSEEIDYFEVVFLLKQR